MAGSRKLGRASDHRKAMLRGMVTYLLENGQIETTVTRAKEVRAMAEKMITLGKGVQGNDAAADLLDQKAEGDPHQLIISGNGGDTPLQ